MKTKDIVLASLLLAMGLVLHSITPAILGSVKPDFLLATMFIAVLTQPKLKNTILIGTVAGIMAAMTTSFPGGQIPSIFDKLISALFVYALYVYVFGNKINSIKMSLISFTGTFVSGFVFLGSAAVMVGLPAPFMALVIAVVLPTSFANVVICLILQKAFEKSRSLSYSR